MWDPEDTAARPVISSCHSNSVLLLCCEMTGFPLELCMCEVKRASSEQSVIGYMGAEGLEERKSLYLEAWVSWGSKTCLLFCFGFFKECHLLDL